jgi:hypothetical protein
MVTGRHTFYEGRNDVIEDIKEKAKRKIPALKSGIRNTALEEFVAKGT